MIDADIDRVMDHAPRGFEIDPSAEIVAAEAEDRDLDVRRAEFAILHVCQSRERCRVISIQAARAVRQQVAARSVCAMVQGVGCRWLGMTVVLLRPFRGAGRTVQGRDRHAAAIFWSAGLERLDTFEPESRRVRCAQYRGRARGCRQGVRAMAGRAARYRRSTACRSASRTSSRPSTCRPSSARRCSTAGSRTRTRRRVAALRAAGAIILGKTVTTEFAMAYPRGTAIRTTCSARLAARAAASPRRSARASSAPASVPR